MKDCARCWGTGKEINHLRLGRSVRRLREERGISLKAFADRMGITPSFLCYLEQGKRHWSQELWKKACQ